MKACTDPEREPLNFRLEKEATLYMQVAAIHLNIQRIFSDHILYGKLSSCTRNIVVTKTAKISAFLKLTF